MAAIKIRNMQEKDIERVIGLHVGESDTLARTTPFEELAEQHRNFLDHIQRRMKVGKAFVAELAGDVQGYSTSCAGPRYLSLVNLFVNRHFRGLGMGKKLVEENARLALNEKFNRMRLQLPTVGEKEAKQFYLRLGFRDYAGRTMELGDLHRFLRFAENPGNYTGHHSRNSEPVYFVSPSRIATVSSCQRCQDFYQ